MALRKPASRGSRYKQKKIDPVKFFIAYEGANDEARYFKALATVFEDQVPKQLHQLFEFIPVKKSSTNGANKWVYSDLNNALVSHGIKKIKSSEVAFIVIDCDHYFTDTHLKSSLQTLQTCKQRNIHVICSNPSFEVWRICHYLDLSSVDEEFLSKAVNNKNSFLKKEFAKLSSKNGLPELFKRTCIALQNEGRLKAKLNCVKTPPTKLQSNVGLIFKEIESYGMPVTKYL